MTRYDISPKSSAAPAKAPSFQRVTVIVSTEIRNFLHKYRFPIAAVLLILILIPAARFGAFLLFPPGSGSRVEVVELGRGKTLRALAGDLQSRGIISSARLFSLYARLKGGDAQVKAGVYQFSDGMRPGEILAKMVAGEVYQRLFALPEGYSSYQVAEMLEKRGIFGKEAFLAACRDQKLLSELGIGARSAEGYLFAGSYNILPGKSEREVVREMVQRQKELLEECLSRGGNTPLTRHQILTLASMVEKEAVLPAEKPFIAAVFHNRLRMGMRLQSDPTAVYGVRAFSGKVTKSDILRPSPYNTYLIPGLPPGPIGNPGKEAIEAVLNPPSVPYIFFVARGDGSHHFTSDLTSHNGAVRKYLKSPGNASPGGPR